MEPKYIDVDILLMRMPEPYRHAVCARSVNTERWPNYFATILTTLRGTWPPATVIYEYWKRSEVFEAADQGRTR